ncbi:MAG: hypothetical protein ACM3ZT_00865 [Bacillota bacterium]
MRYFLCVVWSLGAAVGFFVLTQVAIAGYVFFRLPDIHDPSAVTQAATDYVQTHAAVIRGLDLIAFLLGALLGARGAWRGRLPGTRRSA